MEQGGCGLKILTATVDVYTAGFGVMNVFDSQNTFTPNKITPKRTKKNRTPTLPDTLRNNYKHNERLINRYKQENLRLQNRN